MKKVSARASRGGFTLIELLVAVAIIGILAAIVLASLGAARGKGNDASVKSMMGSVRTAAAEQFFLLNNAYGSVVGGGSPTGVCTAASGGSTMWTDTASNMAGLIAEITSKVGGATKVNCATVPTAFAVAAELPSGGSFWCVDSTGAARGVASTTQVAYNALIGPTGAKSAVAQTTCR